MPYVHLLWKPSTMWLPFRKYGVRLWRRVRFWRGARIVTRMTPNTLYTRSNSLLMCVGVPFHSHRFVPLASSLEHSVHQLQWSRVPWTQRVFLKTGSASRPRPARLLLQALRGSLPCSLLLFISGHKEQRCYLWMERTHHAPWDLHYEKHWNHFSNSRLQ